MYTMSSHRDSTNSSCSTSHKKDGTWSGDNKTSPSSSFFSALLEEAGANSTVAVVGTAAAAAAAAETTAMMMGTTAVAGDGHHDDDDHDDDDDDDGLRKMKKLKHSENENKMQYKFDNCVANDDKVETGKDTIKCIQ